MIAFQYGVEGHTFLWHINCIVRRNCNAHFAHSWHALHREISTQVLIKIVVMFMVALTSNPIPLVLFATKMLSTNFCFRVVKMKANNEKKPKKMWNTLKQERWRKVFTIFPVNRIGSKNIGINVIFWHGSKD